MDVRKKNKKRQEQGRKNRQRGCQTEYDIMKILKTRGYDPVIRSAGSHGPWDVVAYKPHSDEPGLFIQAKSGKDKWPSACEVEVLCAEALKLAGRGVCQLWLKISHGKGYPVDWYVRPITYDMKILSDWDIEYALRCARVAVTIKKPVRLKPQ
jgi:hypothetical protein